MPIQALFDNPDAAVALADALREALLVETPDRHIALTNAAFHSLFGIPVPPAALRGVDCAVAATGSAQLFADPVAFGARIDQILASRAPVHGERLAMADGRTVSRDFLPLANGGIMWVYREVEAPPALDLGPLGAAVAALPPGPATAAVQGELRRLLGEAAAVLPDDLDPDVRELLPMFLEGRRTDLAALRAAEGLDVALRIGHQLKGTGATFGLPALGDLGHKLEVAAKAEDPQAVADLVDQLADLLDRIDAAL